MSTQALQAFRGEVSNSEQLQAAVRACAMDLGAIAALGRKHGFDFTSDEIQSTFSASGGELSDFELEMVSAGTAIDCGTSTSTHG
jgi:predicted ribosomally synthesized peptide with nif11-like leader